MIIIAAVKGEEYCFILQLDQVRRLGCRNEGLVATTKRADYTSLYFLLFGIFCPPSRVRYKKGRYFSPCTQLNRLGVSQSWSRLKVLYHVFIPPEPDEKKKTKKRRKEDTKERIIRMKEKKYYKSTETIRDRAKLNLAGHRVRRLSGNYFEPCHKNQ